MIQKDGWYIGLIRLHSPVMNKSIELLNISIRISPYTHHQI